MKVVGIGASAGGIGALKHVLSHLAKDNGAAYVIIQHLSPDFKSVMEDLLQKYTEMPVKVLKKNQTMNPNSIYLMPSDRTVIYHQGVLVLKERPAYEKLNLPIDEFFHSIGSELKNDAIAVVLSGTGTDGSRGARSIKENEGIVLVQSPETAEFDGMPRALIQLDIADGILAPDQLAKKLNEVIRMDYYISNGTSENGEYLEESNGDNNEKPHKNYFDNIVALASEESSITFSEYKRATLQRRIEKQMALHHQKDVKSYYEFLQHNEKQVEALYKDFLISVTRFFRDQDFFDELKDKVIPRIFAGLKKTETCRIWVAACSTGEEAYSIGILILEYLQENKLDHDFKIFASDVNKRCITFATKGIYNASTLADVPGHLVSKYFKQKGEYFQTVTDLRDRIIFAIHDAIADPPFINMNLISCRNFLIYLKPETQNKILKTFYFSIKENQFLALGPSESIGELNGVFKQYDYSHNIFVKEVKDHDGLRQVFKPSPKLWSKRLNSYSDLYFTPAKEKIKFVEEVSDPFSIYLLRRYVPRTMFLNEDMDVLHINGNLEAILSLPKAIAQMNLQKMLPKANVLFFQEAIRLLNESKESRVFKNISFGKGKTVTHADVRFEKVQLVGLEEPVILVQFDYLAAENIPPQTIVESTYSEDDFDQERILSLQNQIADQKRKMKSMVQQLEAANEELNSSNHELLQSNQELQSTNEELQSLNEELHTVNSELQLKNKELVIANSDISNLLKTTNIGTIFLDDELRIRKFTKAITNQFDLIQGDIGRPITSFNNKLKGINLGTLCKGVLKSGQPVEKEVVDKNDQQYILRLFPYFSKSITNIEGIVITLVDINNVVKAKSELEQVGKKLRSLIGKKEKLVLLLDKETNIIFVNQSFANFTPIQVIGKKLYDLVIPDMIESLKLIFDEVIEQEASKKILLKINAGTQTFEYPLMIELIYGDLSHNKDEASIIATEVDSLGD